MQDKFAGVHWMLSTPFNESEQVDYESLARLIVKAREFGCVGVVVLGVTGEVAKLTDSERYKIVEFVVQKAAGLSVVVGTTGSGTAVAVARSQEADQLGAHALMIAPPPIAKPNLAAVIHYYSSIAAATSLPLVIQDYPAVSGVYMTVELMKQLADQLPSFKYLKLEDPPTPAKLSMIKKSLGDRIGVFGGLGGLCLFDELNRGSLGAMTGFAFIEVFVEIVQYMQQQQHGEARELFYKYLPLVQMEMQEGIGLSIRKEALRLRGLIDTALVRHPGVNIDDVTRNELKTLVSWLGLEF
ncbi:MAG: dihydrodipicolinate synthase family protein [Dehalococcoidia bacterium]|nr:dihydrodipicolinate synthase family protein [Dehalococcoidia bacterium]|tara:strand:+ start:5052 stop:5945 length:894 start_codon:yes stop_codon:yes gene_type:complete